MILLFTLVTVAGVLLFFLYRVSPSVAAASVALDFFRELYRSVVYLYSIPRFI